MGSWLGVMVNQIRPLHYDDQATDKSRATSKTIVMEISVRKYLLKLP